MTAGEVLTSEQQTILDVEAARIDAMVREDIAALERILADDLTYVHSGGRVDDKAAFLDVIRSQRSHYLGVDYSATSVVICGKAAALVRGRAQIRLQRDTGERPSYPVWFLDVYEKRDGRWQMVAWQATRAPD